MTGTASCTSSRRPRIAAALAVLALAGGLVASSASAQPAGEERIHLDYQDVELTVVIEAIAKLTNRNFIYDDRVRGRVTIVSPSPVTADQAYAVFESVLKVKGFTTVRGPGGVYKIIPVRDAKESNIDTIKDSRPAENRDRFVTRLIPLLYIDAESISNTIKPLVSKDASLVAYDPTNTIIVTDTSANIQRLLSIFEAIDIETHKAELAVIQIEYADADTLAEQISEIYGAEVGDGTATTARAARRSRASRRARRRRAAQQETQSQPGSQVRIMTDERTNSLLVLASRSQLEDIRDLVRKLDVEVTGGGRIHVYYLLHADAEELAQTLQGLLGGARPAAGGGAGAGRTGAAGGQPQALRSAVTELAEGISISPDAATNSLVIQASKEAYETLKEVIGKLDIQRPQVLVEALIMEVNVTDNEALGVRAALNVISGDLEFALQGAGTIATAGIVPGGAAGGAPFGIGDGLAGVFNSTRDVDDEGNPTGDGTVIASIIDATADNSDANVLSAPHILTSDNEEAEIRIGDNIPIITSRVDQATGNTAGLASSVNVERQDIGVTLRVTPQISEGETLRLTVFQEITNVNTNAIGGDPNEVGVSLTNRRIENTVVVADGETVVIGGLISDNFEDSVTKVPFLGDIPFFGWLFKSTETNLRKNNLLVFLTPHIVRSREALEYETIRKRAEFQSDTRYGPQFLEEDHEDEGGAALYESLRDHQRQYPLERMVEIEQSRAARAEAEAAARAARAEELQDRYLVQAAIFRDDELATETLTLIIDRGFDASLVSTPSGSELVFELQVGPYESLREATRTADVLEGSFDLQPHVIVVPGDGTEVTTDGAGADEEEPGDSPGSARPREPVEDAP